MEREGLREQRLVPRRGVRALIPSAETDTAFDKEPGPPADGAGSAPRDSRWLACARGAVTATRDLARRALDPGENPFLAVELRAQARKRALPRNLLLHALALAALFCYLLWLAKRPWSPSLFSFQHFLTLHLVTGVAAVHGWLIVHASSSRAREAAQREETARMWEMLLVTPLSPIEIVLFKSVYPLLYAGLIALVALPVYVLAGAASGWSPGILVMLYVVYGLVAVRLVAPQRQTVRRRRRRPTQSTSSVGSLFLWLWVWLWLLSWAGLALLPLSPLSGAMFLTWPVVGATILPTPYPFFRTILPPFLALLVLGPPLFVMNLRWAAGRLAAQVGDAPAGVPVDSLRRSVIVGAVVVVLGYAWPRLIEAGGLATFLRLTPDPDHSLAALGWLLLALWWLVFGIGGLLNLPAERREAAGDRPPRFFSGWLNETGSGPGPLRAMAGLVAPPLLLFVLGCLLAWRIPPPVLLTWVGRTLLVALGAAWLTLALARRLRASLEARRTADQVLAWFWIGLLLAAPLLLLSWQEPLALRLSAVSPVMGFLAVVPGTPMLAAAPGRLPPWWLTPVLNAGAALLLGLMRPASLMERPAPATAAPRAVPPARRRVAEGRMSQWVERFAGWYDNPVLVRELRVYARRSSARNWFLPVSIGAMLGSVALLPVLLLLYYTNVGAYDPGGIPLRSYLSIVTGFASGIPLRFFPDDLSGVRLFYASLMTLILLAFSLAAVLTAPIVGATTFSQERRKGTLGFLLLTPMGEHAIALGKLLGAAAPLLIALLCAFPTAAAAAALAFSPDALRSLLLAYTWLLVACLTGSAFGMLASLLLPGENDPQGLPLLAMLVLQGWNLYWIAQLQYSFTGSAWYNSKLEITAWFVLPFIALEAGLGFGAYIASVALLARARRQDVRFVTEK